MFHQPAVPSFNFITKIKVERKQKIDSDSDYGLKMLTQEGMKKVTFR